MTQVTQGALAPNSTGKPSARHIGILRRASLGALVMLVLQLCLGMAVNLYVSTKDATPGGGFFPAIGHAISNGPVSLTLHVIVGIFLLVASLVLLVQAARSGHRLVIVLSAVGFIAVLGAFTQGAEFANKGQNGASMAMAVLAGVAMLCYGANLFVLGPHRPSAASA